MIVDFLRNLINKRFLSILLLILILVLFDQLTKSWFYMLISNNGGLVNLNSMLNFVAVKNHGISFGMFNNFKYANLFFIVTTVAILSILLKILMSKNKILHISSVSMIIAGAIGNLIDRLNYGYVRDFIDFHINNWHFPTFNIADSMISIGVLICIFTQKNVFNA